MPTNTATIMSKIKRLTKQPEPLLAVSKGRFLNTISATSVESKDHCKLTISPEKDLCIQAITPPAH